MTEVRFGLNITQVEQFQSGMLKRCVPEEIRQRSPQGEPQDPKADEAEEIVAETIGEVPRDAFGTAQLSESMDEVSDGMREKMSRLNDPDSPYGRADAGER